MLAATWRVEVFAQDAGACAACAVVALDHGSERDCSRSP